MNKDNLLKNGYVEIIENEDGRVEKTYYNKSFDFTTSDKATCVVSTIFNKAGDFVDEIYDYGSHSVSKNGGLERINGETENGGDYTEMHYFDKDGKYSSRNNYDYIMVRECKNDGTLVYEEKLVRIEETNHKKIDL